MIKKFFGLIALIVALNFSVADAALQPVTDQAGLLSAAQIEQLNQKIKRVEQTHKIKIGVVFAKSVGGRDMVSASDELLQKNFNNGTNGGIVLLVDMRDHKYEIAIDKRMTEKITNLEGIPFLKKKIQPPLSAGNYADAANEFVINVDSLITYYEANGMPYGSRSAKGFDPMAATMAVVAALLIGIFIRSALIGSMSNVRHAMEAIDYLKKDTVQLTENRDTFLFMNVKRRPKGGGGSHGGGGGGGHSGGGGGGSF